ASGRNSQHGRKGLPTHQGHAGSGVIASTESRRKRNHASAGIRRRPGAGDICLEDGLPGPRRGRRNRHLVPGTLTGSGGRKYLAVSKTKGERFAVQQLDKQFSKRENTHREKRSWQKEDHSLPQ